MLFCIYWLFIYLYLYHCQTCCSTIFLQHKMADDKLLITASAEQPAFILLFPFTHHWSFRQVVAIRKLVADLLVTDGRIV